MKKAKIFNLTVVVLIATLIVGFASCNKDKKEPEPDQSFTLCYKGNLLLCRFNDSSI